MVDNNKDEFSNNQEESLEDFLNGPDEDFKDPFLEDEIDDKEFAASTNAQSGGAGKLLKYTAIIALLAGAGYFTYQYMTPNQGSMRDDSFVAYNPTDYSNNSEMPIASDMNAMQQANNNQYKSVTPQEIEPIDLFDNENNRTANNISEALDFIDSEVQSTSNEVVNNTLDNVSIIDDLEEKFPSEPMPSDVVQLVEVEKIDNNVADTPSAPINNAFETFDQSIEENIDTNIIEIEQDQTITVAEVPKDTVTETMNVNDVFEKAPDMSLNDEIIDLKAIPREPVSKIRNKAAATISSSPAEPEPISSKDRPSKVVEAEPAGYRINNAQQLSQANDPRIQDGQSALARGDFSSANRIFSSVLVSDPSNIHALTGKQMAASKMRSNANVQTSISSNIQESLNLKDVDNPDIETSLPENTVIETTDDEGTQKPNRLIDRDRYGSDITRAGQASSATGIINDRTVAIVQPDSNPATSEIIRAPQESSTNDLLEQPVAQREIISVPATSRIVRNPVSNIGNLPAGIDKNPSDARGALALAQSYAQAGQRMKALDWYREALKFDALYNSGLDRLAVYDAMALIQ
jgi:tetratricopeptide (TPR) repeat protein